jgi:hypothetical protein
MIPLKTIIEATSGLLFLWVLIATCNFKVLKLPVCVNMPAFSWL